MRRQISVCFRISMYIHLKIPLMEKPDYTPSAVRQALAWLGKMEIACRYVADAGLWEFVYDGLYLLLINDCADDELGIYAPMLITDSDNEQIRQIVYECSVPAIEAEFSPDCDFGYQGDGLCHVARWWTLTGAGRRLTKKALVGRLKEMRDAQLRLHFILHGTYEGMFNSPKEVLEDIFKRNSETT